MAYLTYKVDADLLQSPEFFALTDKQRSTFFVLLSVLEKGSIPITKLEFLLRERLGGVLKAIETAGFVKIADGIVYQTGKGAFRHTDTERNKKWREDKKASPETLTEICRKFPSEVKQAGIVQDISQAHLAPQSVHQTPPVVVNITAPATKKISKTHDAGVRESMVSDGVDAQLADEWLAQRVSGVKYGKSPVTARAWAGVKREATTAKWPINAAIERMVEMQWQSFKAVYVSKEAIPGSAAAKAGLPSNGGLPNVPVGYYKDAHGRLQKRQQLSL